VLPDARWPSNAGSGRRVDRTLIRDEREKLERTVHADLTIIPTPPTAK
jgi:hypothetical protein